VKSNEKFFRESFAASRICRSEMCSRMFDISKWIVGGDSKALLISCSTEE